VTEGTKSEHRMSDAFCRPQSQALTRRVWTHGRAVKPVWAVLSDILVLRAVHSRVSAHNRSTIDDHAMFMGADSVSDSDVEFVPGARAAP